MGFNDSGRRMQLVIDSIESNFEKLNEITANYIYQNKFLLTLMVPYELFNSGAK